MYEKKIERRGYRHEQPLDWKDREERHSRTSTTKENNIRNTKKKIDTKIKRTF